MQLESYLLFAMNARLEIDAGLWANCDHIPEHWMTAAETNSNDNRVNVYISPVIMPLDKALSMVMKAMLMWYLKFDVHQVELEGGGVGKIIFSIIGAHGEPMVMATIIFVK